MNRSDRQPLTLAIILVAAGLTLLFRMLPPDIRSWNLAPAGAMFLFAGARARSWGLFLIPFFTTLGLDLFFYYQHDWALPSESYLAYGFNIFLGWFMLRRTEAPATVLTGSLLSAVGFFLITNTAVWIGMYFHPDPWVGTDFFCEPTWNGLMKCYVQAIPFSKGTFFGDLIFSATFFGVFAWLSRSHFVSERVHAATRTLSE